MQYPGEKAVEKIILAVDEAHTLLAKASYDADTYRPISLLLAASKTSLLDVKNFVSDLQKAVATRDEIIELKEKERTEWADLCIKKQAQIEYLNNEVNILTKAAKNKPTL